MTAKKKCVFFDRDGVVNRPPDNAYVTQWKDFHFNDGIIESLQIVHSKGLMAILITNQKGVPKGFMSNADLSIIHAQMQKALSKEGVAFDAIYACTDPVGEEEDRDRSRYKPSPAMILEAAQDHSIDLQASWFVGDADRDIEAAERAGITNTVRVLGDKKVKRPTRYQLNGVKELPRFFQKVLS